jgi:hypothetical protein
MCELESEDLVRLLVHIPHSDSHSTVLKGCKFDAYESYSGWA